MKITLSKSQWQTIRKNSGYISCHSMNVSQNYYVKLFGKYDPIKYAQAEDRLLSFLVDDKEYNLGAAKCKWSSSKKVFIGGNYFLNPDFGNLYIALHNDGYSDDMIKNMIEQP
jgi:hypothetical protein